jgi:tetrahydrodipicolinate N-succinyltransferase
MRYLVDWQDCNSCVMAGVVTGRKCNEIVSAGIIMLEDTNLLFFDYAQAGSGDIVDLMNLAETLAVSYLEENGLLDEVTG